MIVVKSGCGRYGLQMIDPDEIGTKKHTIIPIGLDMSIQTDQD